MTTTPEQFRWKFYLQPDRDISTREKSAIRMASYTSDNIDLCARYERDCCPVGSVEFVKGIMTGIGIQCQSHMTYPTSLRKYLGRDIREGCIDDASPHEFIKPKDSIKLFTGGILSEISNEIVNISKATNLWISEPVKFICEARYYIYKGCVLGSARYDDADNDAIPDVATVISAVENFTNSGAAPVGYALWKRSDIESLLSSALKKTQCHL